MRIALVTVGDTGRSTGGYLYHTRLLEGLRERGLGVEEVVPCGASPDEQRKGAVRLGASLDPAAFDVIVVDALARVLCAPHLDRWREERPVVAVVHELPSVAGSGEVSGRERAYEEPLLRSDTLVAVSAHGESVLRARGVPPERIRVVPPGFDRLPAGRSAGCSRRAAVRALCVAQWIPRKGIRELVRAWTRHDRGEAELVLVGETDADTAYSETVYAAIAEGPDACVTVAGPVDDQGLADAYAGADLFALPSRYEGYGIVYAEALACGLPVIACDVGPVPALLGREAAVLVPPGDAGALGDALDLLLGDRDLRERMSAAARRRARGLPRWEGTVAGFLNLLEETVAVRYGRGRV